MDCEMAEVYKISFVPTYGPTTSHHGTSTNRQSNQLPCPGHSQLQHLICIHSDRLQFWVWVNSRSVVHIRYTSEC